MLFGIVILILVLAVAFFHYTQGLFSAVISTILAVFAAVLAVSYHEWVVESLLGGKMADMAHGAVLLLLFAAFYLIPRVAFDMLVPGNVRVPALVDKIGGAALGLVAGVFAAGVVALAAQEMPFGPSLWGYSRYEVESKESVTVPVGTRNLERPMYEALTAVSFDEAKEKEKTSSLLLPVDDALIGLVRKLSNDGSLAGDPPLDRVHPDWLTELYGQRVGIQPGAQRVAIVNDKRKDVRLDGVFFLDAARLEVKDAEVTNIHQIKLPPMTEKSKQLFVVRVFFSKDARDPDNLIRFSPGSIRLVTQAKPAGSTDAKYVNYFPIGTLDWTTDRDRPILFINKPDDYLFLSDAADTVDVILGAGRVIKAQGGDKAADLVFYVDTNGFIDGDFAAFAPTTQSAAPSTAPAAGKAKPAAGAGAAGGGGGTAKITADTFLEVKRLARADLGGTEIRRDLKAIANVSVLRKEKVLNPPPGTNQPAVAVTPTPTPSPTPAAPKLSGKLAGNWDTLLPNGLKVNMAFTPTAATFTFQSVGGTNTKQGPWKEVRSEGNTVTIQLDFQGSPSQTLAVTFDGDDRITVEPPGNADANQRMVLNRKVGG